MSSMLQAATSWESLKNVSDPRLPYRFDRIFQGEGFFARRLSKKRLEILRQLDTALGKMLEEGEKIEYVSWGIEYSFVEAYFLGLWHYMLNRRAVLLTDRRILILQVSSRRKLLDLKSHVRYASIRRFGRRSLGVLTLELRDGTKLLLTGLPRRDRKELRARIQERLEGLGASERVASAPGRQNLCPRCYQTVTGRPAQCPHCYGHFKSAGRAGGLSLLFPGLGDWYLGHRGLACVEILGALACWGIAIPALSAGLVEMQGAAAEISLLAGGVAVVFLTSHGIDAWITRRIGLKGLYPGRG